MERMTEVNTKIALSVGTLCLIVLAISIIVFAVKSVVRSITDIRYASKVKFYLEDGHRRIAEYEKRIKAIEKEVANCGEHQRNY